MAGDALVAAASLAGRYLCLKFKVGSPGAYAVGAEEQPEQLVRAARAGKLSEVGKGLREASELELAHIRRLLLSVSNTMLCR